MSRAYVSAFIATITSYALVRAVWPSLLIRISYQVGSPWMFDGKRFLPETGIPMRKMACMRRPLALAEPEPLTLASLMAKSLMRGAVCVIVSLSSARVARLGRSFYGFPGVGLVKHEALHVPRSGRAALGAEPAVHADVLVLHHEACSLRQRARREDVLRQGFR